MPADLFSDEERARIRDAVAAAEKRTSGEIVPYVVLQSSRYDAAVWRAAGIGALLAAAATLAFAWLYEGWGHGWLYSAWAMALAMTAGGVLGALVAGFFAGVQRVLTSPAYLTEQVHRRAMQAFVEEEVFNTRDRTGILLFVSLREHRIEVFGDAGINAKVAQAEWADVVLRVREGIRRGDLAGGVVDAVERCGDLLERRGVAVQETAVDELPDDVRVRGR